MRSSQRGYIWELNFSINLIKKLLGQPPMLKKKIVILLGDPEPDHAFS